MTLNVVNIIAGEQTVSQTVSLLIYWDFNSITTNLWAIEDLCGYGKCLVDVKGQSS